MIPPLAWIRLKRGRQSAVAYSFTPFTEKWTNRIASGGVLASFTSEPLLIQILLWQTSDHVASALRF